MISSGAIIHNKKYHSLLYYNEIDSPVALQLGGSDPEDLAKCIDIVNEFGYDEINLNVGCPSKRVQKGAFGACLMLDPKLITKCLRSMTEASSTPISVKCRIGVDEHDDYDFLKTFVEAVAKANVKIIIVHARKAYLSGLSPRQNRSIPELKYEVVYKFKEDFPNDKDLYHGNYIIDIAKMLFKNSKKINLNRYEDSFDTIKNKSLDQSLKLIKSDLKLLGIKHDVFFSESNMIKKKYVDKIINVLKKNNHVTDGYLSPPKGEETKTWKKTKRLIFKSSNFGDDSDRALQKNDGSWTYFANDIGYHFKKVSKKYDKLINVLGADHIGYIKRISAAVTAISNNKISLTCKVCQLVKFIKNGQPFKMSKRSGDFFPLSKLLSEVNKDAIRFMMLYRSNDVEIEFDFNKILEKNKDNPVFYVQYCYARINSIFNTLNINPNKKINYNFNEFKLNTFEEKLLRKIIEWPKIVDISSEKLEPHRITFYLYQLSTIFHSYWSKGNEDKNLKFINNGKINDLFTLKLFQLISIILENGMFILGVSLPKKM